MEKKIQTTIVYQKNLQEYQNRKFRIIANEGGTGSSKTISLAQLFATIMLNENGVQITIARKTLPSLKATAMRDFFIGLTELGIYREAYHNKSEHIYRYRNNEVDFISVDEPMKVRSRRRQFLWMNETNEFDLEDYRQLSLRTSGQIYMDYNPSHQYHWIYDEVLTRPDCHIIQSTYRDNPFLSSEIVKEIEGYRTKDENYWRIYGLGLRGIAKVTVYTHWEYCDKFPESIDSLFYGLDFGYNNPTALVEVGVRDKEYFAKEKIYESGLTNTDLIKKLDTLKIPKNIPIYADSAEPQRIKEIRDKGYNIIGCFKSEIKDGVDTIKSHRLCITKDSLNLLKEVKSYSWREKDGKILDEPVKINDHLLDALRYAIITYERQVPVKFEWL